MADPLLFLPIVLMAIGWMCIKRPTSVVRFMTAWLDLPNATGQLNKSQEIAKYIRAHPDTWARQYPLLYRQIQLSGVAAYVIAVGGLVIMFMSWLVPSATR